MDSVDLYEKFDINEMVIPLHAMLFSQADYKICHLSLAFSISQQAVGKASALAFCLVFTKYLYVILPLLVLFLVWQ